MISPRARPLPSLVVSLREGPLDPYRRVVVERGGAPTAAPTEPQHGAGDPKEPAAREPTDVRADGRRLRAPVEKPGEGRRALLARAGGAPEDHPAARRRGTARDRASRGSHADSLRDCSSACQSRRREYARSQLDRNK